MKTNCNLLRCLGLALMCLCFTGCRSPESVKKAAGTGRAHVFQATYDQAWEASLEALKPARIGQADKAEGQILFSTSAAGSQRMGEIVAGGLLVAGVFGSHGEIGVVTIKPVDDARTRIEVVVKERSAMDIGVGSALMPREIYKKIASQYRMLE